MKHLVISIVFIFCFAAGKAQIVVTFILDKIPNNNHKDPVYITGNFNGWKPADSSAIYKKQADGKWVATLKLPHATLLEYKLTKGTWPKVECSIEGKDVENRKSKIQTDTTIICSVTGWRNDFAALQKKHTATAQVSILSDSFYLKPLNRKRRIWMYLPKDYTTSLKRYPVLYLQDAQNIFDDYTAGFGEWGVDELLDNYYTQTSKSCIVIGIEHGGEKRLTEYNPYTNQRFGNGEGKQYIQSIVETLKPFVDSSFRTITSAANTFIGGSSMGGIISQWAVMAYPKTFGKAGIFSPAFWIAPSFKKNVATMMKKYKGSLFYYCGQKEDETMEAEMKTVITEVKKVSNATITTSINPNGQHNEQAWHNAFDVFLQMLFAK